MKTALSNDFRYAKNAFAGYVHYAPEGVELTDVLDASYWVNVCERLRRFDEILILHQGDAFETRLRVTCEYPHFALREVPAARWEAQRAPVSAALKKRAKQLNLEVSHGGAQDGWRVLHGDKIALLNGAKLVNLGSEGAAYDALTRLIEAA